jgi:hypothetical protein
MDGRVDHPPDEPALEVIDRDSLAVQRRISCLCFFAPTRTLPQDVLMDWVWIPDGGTPRSRIAPTIAPTLRFAADNAGGDVEAERVTDSDIEATSGVTIIDP